MKRRFLNSFAYPKITVMKPKLVTFALLGLFFTSSNAQFRKYSNEFLNIGAGARGLAMGSAQVASAQDGTAG